MSRVDLKTGEVFLEEAGFHSRVEENFEVSERSKIFDRMSERMLENLANFQTRESNWRFNKVVDLTVFFVKYQPLRAGRHMKLLSKLKNKKAIVNLKNEDEKCFKWSVTRALFPVKKDPQRVSK